jgi:hypothetical protein
VQTIETALVSVERGLDFLSPPSMYFLATMRRLWWNLRGILQLLFRSMIDNDISFKVGVGRASHFAGFEIAGGADSLQK